jgi:hypothetical protein
MKGCGTLIGRGLAFIVVMTLAGGDASAQDLDRDKPAAKLFAANCAGCHRSPRGLIKGRFSWSLSSFLQQHYTSSAATARDLAAYLQAADAQRGKAPPSARKKSRPAGSAAAPPDTAPAAPSSAPEGPRPPAQVPAGAR